MHLTLVRHGESTWNATDQWQGQSDVPLSPRGRLQARALATRMFGDVFDRRICSDLSRARDTAAALGEAVPEPRFREIDVGAWAGLHHREVAERFPDEVAGLRAGRPVRIGGGESMPEFEGRVDEALDELRAGCAGQRVLVVTHGGVVLAIARRILGMRGRPSALVGVGNTSLTRVRCERAALRLETYNDGVHLDAADLAPSVSPEDTLRLAVITADPRAGGDRALADALLSGLGIARIAAAGAAREAALSTELSAEPLCEGAAGALVALRAEQEHGACALVLAPDEARALVADLLGLDEGGREALVPPAHGTVAQLRLSARGALLHSYGVSLSWP